MTPSVKILCWVAFSIMICFSQLAAATTRGLKRVVVEDSSGNKNRLYSQSHALVIGVSDYQVAGWANLESVKGDVSSVRSALENHGFNVVVSLNPTTGEFIDVVENFIREYGYEEENRLLFY